MISYKDKDLEIPMARGDSGEYTALIKSWLVNIMYGKEGTFQAQDNTLTKSGSLFSLKDNNSRASRCLRALHSNF